MHNKENQPYYNKKNGLEGEMFEKVIYDILNNNNFEIAIRTVKTLNSTSYGASTILRLKNVNSEFSDKFKDAVSENTQPIVMSGGLWNDLTYWEKNSNKLMQDLLNNGRDLWEIEITGGPGQDGDESSPNYNYNDLSDYYFPALIAGVQKYSGQRNLSYVGHSNGCGVALASINKYQSSGKNDAGYYFDTTTGDYQSMDLSSNAIDTFAGEGCPGALKGYSPFYKYFGMFGEKIKTQIGDHTTAAEVSQRLFILCNTTLTGNERQYCILAAKGLGRVEGDHRLSKNLLLDYLKKVNDNSNPTQVDNDLSMRKFRLYANTDFGFVRRQVIEHILGGDFDTTQLKHDIVVSQQDSQQLSDKIVSLNSIKLYNLSDFEHGRVDISEFTKDLGVFINEK